MLFVRLKIVAVGLMTCALLLPAAAKADPVPSTHLSPDQGIALSFDDNDTFRFEKDGTLRMMNSSAAAPCDADHEGSLRWAQWALRLEGCDGGGTWKPLTGELAVHIKSYNVGLNATCAQAIVGLNGVTGNTSGYQSVDTGIVAGDGSWLLIPTDAASDCANLSVPVNTMGMVAYDADGNIMQNYFTLAP